MVVSADRQFLATPLPGGGGPNPLCANAEQKAPAGLENERMVGIMLTYGRFKFLNLTDLDWATEMKLACPVNKLGTVTVYQTDRHGSWDGAGAPAFLGAIAPQVIVFNNGPRKGLGSVDKNAKTDHARGNARPAVREKRLRPGGEAPRDRRHLAGTPVATRQGPGPQHLARHDREPRRDRGVQGALDQGVRGIEWQVHDHERQERVQQDVHGALDPGPGIGDPGSAISANSNQRIPDPGSRSDYTIRTATSWIPLLP